MRLDIKTQGTGSPKIVYQMLISENNDIICWSKGTSKDLQKINETDTILDITKQQYNTLCEQEFWKYKYIDNEISGVEETRK